MGDPIPMQSSFRFADTCARSGRITFLSSILRAIDGRASGVQGTRLAWLFRTTVAACW